MKKLFVFFLLLCVFSLGIVAALAVVPHAHGEDADHSDHGDCPVCQVDLHGFQAVIDIFSFTLVCPFALFLLVFVHVPFSHALIQASLSRASPIPL